MKLIDQEKGAIKALVDVAKKPRHQGRFAMILTLGLAIEKSQRLTDWQRLCTYGGRYDRPIFCGQHLKAEILKAGALLDGVMEAYKKYRREKMIAELPHMVPTEPDPPTEPLD